MGHGDFGYEVGAGDYAVGEAVAFGAEDDGEVPTPIFHNIRSNSSSGAMESIVTAGPRDVHVNFRLLL